MDKQNGVYPYNGILFGHERYEVLIHPTTCMNLENMLSERSLTLKTYSMVPFVWNVPDRQTYRDRTQSSVCLELGEKESRRESEINFFFFFLAWWTHSRTRTCLWMHNLADILKKLNCTISVGK